MKLTQSGFLVRMLIIAAAGPSGCSRLNKPSDEKAAFEIREVSCSEQTSESAWIYTCQGTLLTRENQYQDSELIVWYQDTTKRAGVKDTVTNFPPLYFKMSKGVATLLSSAYYSRKRTVAGLTIGDYETDPGSPEPTWNVLGFSRLEAANVSVQK